MITGKANKSKRCYTVSTGPNCIHPRFTLEENIPTLLENTNISVLVIQAPISDITNLNKTKLKESEMIIKAQKISEELISLCKKTLIIHPDLKQLVILERPKRHELFNYV